MMRQQQQWRGLGKGGKLLTQRAREATDADIIDGSTQPHEAGRAALAKLDGTTSNETWSSRKSSKKPKETAATASQPDPTLWAEYLFEIKQAQDATEKAKTKAEQAVSDMFQLYANLLSINAKYSWN